MHAHTHTHTYTHTHTHTLLPMLNLGKSALREASEANTLLGSDEHVIQGEEGIICSFIWFIPLDVFCSAAAAVSLQEMKVFTELGHPFAQLQNALQQA